MTMRMDKDEYSVYLPAVNTQYADTLATEISKDRPFPKTLKLEDLMFWESDNKYWHQPYYLHSVGQYKIGSTPDNAVTRRSKCDGVLFGDSGGFQIGKGSLTGFNALYAGMSGDEACFEWRNAIEVRKWIVGWLETHCNYAMTIDMPLWATLDHAKESPFHHCTHEQLIQLTVENLRFIDNHRQGNTKWLNVVQCTNTETMQKWWEAVKWFECGGYAFSSSSAKIGGLIALLEPLLIMRDDNAFKAGCDWLHILGISTAQWAIMFTALQRVIRSTVNENFRISFDSSSPLQDAGIREQYTKIPEFGTNKSNWSFKKEQFPHARIHVGSNEPLPFSSPIADQLTHGHLNVRDEHGKYTVRQVDTLSLVLVANHNIWTMLEAFRQANDLVFASDRSQVPTVFSECVDMIEHVFTVENWADELKKNEALLAGFKG